MSIKALQDYTLYAKYAKYIPEKQRREVWSETVDRVFGMHETKFKKFLDENEDFRKDFYFAKEQVLKKRVLGAQRALQFGGDPILKNNCKLYNCSVLYVDRPRSFQETMYLLLCGCGVGFSVQEKHNNLLPEINLKNKGEKIYQVTDDIEGWANAVGVLVNSYFTPDQKSEFYEYQGYNIIFDTSLIRTEGAPITGGFKAPGPKGLENALVKINQVILSRLLNGEKKLHPIDSYDILMHASDAVLSGGLRRSATICIFSKTDGEMMKAKTGDWFLSNPQRGRSNNSVALLKNKTTKEEFLEIINSVKEFGEPGFVWLEDEDIIYNPCVEIGMMPKHFETGESGIQFCNLTEINAKKIKSEEDFLQAARAGAILGTLQAAYTDFAYLGKVSEEIVRHESLLGVSMTGMMDSPDIVFDEKIQRKAAKEVLKVNEKISKIIGINLCARATCVKPAGSTSCILGSSSGVHPHHSKRYFRRVQANKLEFPLQHFTTINPLAVEKSVWSANNTDYVVSFLCEVPAGSIIKNQIKATDLLEKVKLTQQNWVEYGTREEKCLKSYIRHNVSNTITVKDDEWGEVGEYIFKNRQWFAGISLLPFSGDKDYPQAPFCSVPSLSEYQNQYGEAGLFASGLIVDGLKAFNDNLWAACDTILGIGEKLDKFDEPIRPDEPKKNGYSNKEYLEKLKEHTSTFYTYLNEYESWEANYDKIEWVRRAKQFANRYFDGNLRLTTYCLKDCSNLKLWNDLKREYKDIDWSEVVEEQETKIDVGSLVATACAGGSCQINF